MCVCVRVCVWVPMEWEWLRGRSKLFPSSYLTIVTLITLESDRREENVPNDTVTIQGHERHKRRRLRFVSAQGVY